MFVNNIDLCILKCPFDAFQNKDSDTALAIVSEATWESLVKISHEYQGPLDKLLVYLCNEKGAALDADLVDEV